MKRRAATQRNAKLRSCAVLGSLLVALGATEARSESAPGPTVARGSLLIASDQLGDPNFRQTVILLLEYAPEGALGVVINRPTDVPLATLLPEVTELRGRNDLVFLGGPVARDRMILLVRATTPPAASARVVDGVFITSSLEVLRQMPHDKDGAAHFRTYVGYAGWGPKQVDAEIARGDWHVLPATPAALFDAAPSGVWRELNERASGQWVRAPLLSPQAPDPLALVAPELRTAARAVAG